MKTMLFFLILCFTIFAKGQWVKEMENSALYEGDIVLDPDEKLGYASIKGGRWPNAVIPYTIESSVSSGVRANIPNAIAEYHKHTCLRFKERTTESAYISFYGGKGCSSPVGYRRGRRNRVSLASGCRGRGTIMHEIGHSIGIYHEQSRPDRDLYVEILFENIRSGMSYNFKKHSSSIIDSLGTPYDYLSMMHYGKRAFGTSGKITIKTKDPVFQDRIGRRSGFSKIDIQQINKMYCDGTGNTTKPLCEDITGKPCALWLKTGYCKYDYIIDLCCKTCKEGVITTVAPKSTLQTQPPIVSTKNPLTCKDKSGKPCALWLKTGYCKHDFIRESCCKTCKEGFVTTPVTSYSTLSSTVPTQPPIITTQNPTICKDQPGKDCAAFKKYDYCKISSIRRICCKTCKDVIIPTKPQVFTTNNPSICEDKPGKNCAGFKKYDYCNISSVKKICCKTCNGIITSQSPLTTVYTQTSSTVSTKVPVITTKNPATCEDKPKFNCAGWKKWDYCQYSSIKKNCCKTCKDVAVIY